MARPSLEFILFYHGKRSRGQRTTFIVKLERGIGLLCLQLPVVMEQSFSLAKFAIELVFAFISFSETFLSSVSFVPLFRTCCLIIMKFSYPFFHRWSRTKRWATRDCRVSYKRLRSEVCFPFL